MDPKIYKHIRDLASAGKVYDKFCFRMKCPKYIEWKWNYDGSPCKSCKLVGESYQIEKYPKNCLHLEEIEKATTMAMLKGERRVL